MNLNNIKKALYIEKPEANRISEDYDYLYYYSRLQDGTELNFKVPRSESTDEVGNLLFHELEPAQLLIRYIEE